MSTTTQDLDALARSVMHDCDTDFASFFGHFADDCRFQWGNADAVSGVAAIQATVGSTLAGVASLNHTIHETWTGDDSAVLRMDVRYELENGATVGTPAITVMRFRDTKIVEYLIYQDPAPLKAAQPPGRGRSRQHRGTRRDRAIEKRRWPTTGTRLTHG